MRKVLQPVRAQITCLLQVLALAGAPAAAIAGGIFGNALETICGNCGAGKKLDDLHAKAGKPLDVPGRVVSEGLVQTLGPALAFAIEQSRDNARSAGVRQIPQNVLNALAPHFDAALLASVRYRVGQGHELSVQANSMRFGDAIAVSLIDTIVFRSTSDAETNVVLWAHELAHIDQYRRWGVANFAKRYVRDFSAVEREAEDRAKAIANALKLDYSYVPRFVLEHDFLLQTGTPLEQVGRNFNFVSLRNGDVVAIKKSGTGSGRTEAHVLSAGNNYDRFRFQTPTALHETDDSFAFVALANDDIAAIKKRGGGGTTEVHILSAQANYTSFRLQTKTALHETDDSFVFVALGNDIAAIKKRGASTTEVHVLAAAGNYQSFRLQTPTALHPTDGTVEFVALGNDIAAIKKSGTGSGSTEVHVLKAESGYKSWRLQTGTALHQTGDDFTFVSIMGQRLGAIKTRGTGTKTTEVHVVRLN